ncbi:hypothetical protein E4656_18300 [Natronospirillum operosum]|uniref:Uncharacterized protein n=1 Tax=Natronospirillum operosum TaxID=2759953 RepID=A0A4Z0W996_9GAMM|nr:hypothetical protein [Natronospirillum operosum]TGG90671.1 hypothetical protein E4656_18300 [Natronospirillum operosum]
MRHKLDTWVLSAVIVLQIAGLTIDSLFVVIGLLVGLGYLLLRPSLAQRAAGGDKASDSPPPDAATSLWNDTERALRELDRYPADGVLASESLRLGQVGRRAVERGRSVPADPANAQVRHLLCLAGDALRAFVNAGEPDSELASLRALLDEVAQTLDNNPCSAAAEEQMRIRLRVLQKELEQPENKEHV